MYLDSTSTGSQIHEYNVTAKLWQTVGAPLYCIGTLIAGSFVKKSSRKCKQWECLIYFMYIVTRRNTWKVIRSLSFSFKTGKMWAKTVWLRTEIKFQSAHPGCDAHFRFRSKQGKCERKSFSYKPNKNYRNKRILDTCSYPQFLTPCIAKENLSLMLKVPSKLYIELYLCSLCGRSFYGRNC